MLDMRMSGVRDIVADAICREVALLGVSRG
jgi:hypothetical protein